MLILATLAALAAPPTTVHHQGRLLDAAGAPVHGTRDVTLALRRAETGTDPADWSQTLSLTLTDGYFSAGFGPIPDEVLAADALWVELSVDDVAMGPRQPLASSPWAARAADSGASSGLVLTSPSGTSCVRVSLADGATQAASTPIDCATGNPVGLESFSGGWRITGGQHLASCKAYRDHALYAGQGSGAYWIDPDGSGTNAAFKVYCDMVTASGGWTLLAVNNVDADVNLFYKPFAQYAAGWGSIDNVNTNAAWIGLEAMHHLSASGAATLKVSTNTRDYFYAGWNVGNAGTDYTVYVPNSSANPGNANIGFRYAHGRKFSAYDRDNDLSTANHCANQERSGWWYNECWYVQFGDQAASQTYWTESTTGTDYFTTVKFWLR